MRIIILFILFFHLTPLFGQEFSKVVYKIKQDSGFLQRMKMEARNDNMKAQLYERNVEDEKVNFTLIFNNKESVFALDNKKSDPSPTRGMVYHLYDFYNNSISLKRLQLSYSYNIIEPQESFKYEIIYSSRKKIGKYDCILAKITKKKVEQYVWFTPQIPVSTGPGGFVGLPGLVLEVFTNGYQTIYASEISLNDKKIKALPAYSNKPEITREELSKRVAKYRASPEK